VNEWVGGLRVGPVCLGHLIGLPRPLHPTHLPTVIEGCNHRIPSRVHIHTWQDPPLPHPPLTPFFAPQPSLRSSCGPPSPPCRAARGCGFTPCSCPRRCCCPRCRWGVDVRTQAHTCTGEGMHVHRCCPPCAPAWPTWSSWRRAHAHSPPPAHAHMHTRMPHTRSRTRTCTPSAHTYPRARASTRPGAAVAVPRPRQRGAPCHARMRTATHPCMHTCNVHMHTCTHGHLSSSRTHAHSVRMHTYARPPRAHARRRCRRSAPASPT
jgi:hypothetical protein